MKVTKELAKRIAPNLQHGAYWSECRDDVDFATGGELDGFQLDMLTDWAVETRRQNQPDFSVQP